MTFHRLLIVTAAFALLATSTSAGGAGDAPAGGFLPDRLVRIDQAVERAIENGEIPGAVALIARDGQIAYHRAFGFADIESETAMQTDTIFRIASMTKAITTVGVMILYERGHFRLNDPVGKYLPEFADMQVVAKVGEGGLVTGTRPAPADIRIIDLLTHTSGLSYPFIESEVQKTYEQAGVIDGVTASKVTLASKMKVLAAQPLLTEPGTTFTYGLSTDVLGYLIEVVSGMPLDRFIADHISRPLGMDDTYFYLPNDSRGRLATLYAYVDGHGLVESNGTEADIKLDDPNFPITGAKTYFSGGAGMSSTARDYARFCQMLLNDGVLDGVRILSRKSVELMRAPRVDIDGDELADLGLGFNVLTDLGRYGELGSPGTFSWGGAFYTSYWIDPQERLVGVFMSQLRPAQTDIADRFRVLVYQALE